MSGEPEGRFTDLRPQSAPASERPVYRMLIRAEPGVDEIKELRWLLKYMLRQRGLRCLSIEKLPLK
jgi:hypothetical protein